MKPGTDTALIKHMITIAFDVQDPDSAILILNKSLQLSIAGNYPRGYLTSYKYIAVNYFRKGDYEHALLYEKKELFYAVNSIDKARINYLIGDNYYAQGYYDTAETYFYTALGIFQKNHIHDTVLFAKLYNALALINGHLNQDSLRFYYLLEGESIARKGQKLFELATILVNKSNYYFNHHQQDSAMKYLLEAQSIDIKNNFKSHEAEIDQTFGDVYLDSGQYEKALSYYQAGIDLSKKHVNANEAYMGIYASYGIGAALSHLGKNKQAEAITVSALKKADSLHLKSFVLIGYGKLSDLYRASGQYKKALDCMDSSSVLKDSLTGVAKTKAMSLIQVKFNTAEKDRELTQNQLLIAQQNSKIARKNVLTLSVGGGILLLLLVSIGIYLQSINRQKTLEKENKISILQAAVAGGDNERTRIARELHDGIGGMLSAVMMRFSSMHHENAAIAQTAAYNEAMAILREMGDEIRKTAHNLMPEVLLKQSLPEAVRLFCNNVQQEGGLKIDFQSYGNFEGLAQTYKLNLYRIIQELVKNVTIHAHANHVLVQLLQNEDKLIVSVEDNGAGFNVMEIKNGQGLYNINTRVSSMDGHLTLESKSGKGTTIIIELDLPQMMKTVEGKTA